MLGVCSWAIDRFDVLRAIEVAGSIPGVRAIQIGFFANDAVQRFDAEAVVRAVDNSSLHITSTFVAFECEDYSSIKRIAETGGLAWDEAYPRRLALTRAVAELTRNIGADAVAVHVGTVPAGGSDPLFDKLVGRCAEVADMVAEYGIELHLETGREPAGVLRKFLDSLNRSHVAINFDPGNFVVYGTGDPIKAFGELTDRIRVVHLKDGILSAEPGLEFGRAAPLGSGDAKVARIISKLRLLRRDVPMLVECSSIDAGEATVRSSIDYVRSLTG